MASCFFVPNYRTPRFSESRAKLAWTMPRVRGEGEANLIIINWEELLELENIAAVAAMTARWSPCRGSVRECFMFHGMFGFCCIYAIMGRFCIFGGVYSGFMQNFLHKCFMGKTF